MSIFRVDVRPATADDAKALLERGLRREDVLEGLRVSGLPAEDLMVESMSRSHTVVGIFVDGLIVALLGVASEKVEEGLLGIPWLVAHRDFERPETAVPMLRISKRFIDGWREEFGKLGNVLDPEHEKAVRYVEWLGFRFEWDRPLAGPCGDRIVFFWR